MKIFNALKKFLFRSKASGTDWAIDIRDYPRSAYRVYWQYFVGYEGGKYPWQVEFLNFSDSSTALVTSGAADTYEGARLQAQRSAYDEMPKFKR